MNWDIVIGNWKQYKGRIKAQWYKFIDDHLVTVSDPRVARTGERRATACKREDIMEVDIAPRRRVLRGALVVSCGLLAPVALAEYGSNKGMNSSGSSSNGNADTPAPAGKVTQASVQYQTEPKGEQNCSGCTNFSADSNTCKLVDGQISPEGWCTLWSKLA